MMTRENMEEIFWAVGEEHGVSNWYEIFDSDLFEEVCERIARTLGLDRGEYDLWSEMLDWTIGGEFSEWMSEMAEDL